MDPLVRKVVVKCIVGIVSTMILLSCSSDAGTNISNDPLENLSIKASPLTLLTEETSSLSVVVPDIDNSELSYVWSSLSGKLSSTSGPSVQWTAPVTPGTFEISVTVTDGENAATDRITIVVTTLPEFVFVDGGSFTMGNNLIVRPNAPIVFFGQSNEVFPDELPLHTVSVDEFSIGKYEVTNAQYAAFLNIKGNQIENESSWYNENSLFAKINSVEGQFIPVAGFNDHPVTLVTWYGAKAYCDWLAERTGDIYRLPTEAEWEIAARGDDSKNQSRNELDEIIIIQRLYPWGNNINGRFANYVNSGDPFEPGTSPVGFFDGNIRNNFSTKNGVSPYGVYDMVGNVSEWCYDWYDSTYYQISPAANPMGPSTGTTRVRRGGSYAGTFSNLMTASRNENFPGIGLSYTGFRCVRIN